ncbi:signal recognition particle subunit [Sporothrix eucalyptigena]|uniref:Signal recognition particle subunit n=1 Tax=Sporothrix eucalyptigena TaxID=1812306 RepID=A0ABP0AWV0_9PEZI
MSRHARVEEIEDSDDAFSDPSEGDIDDFDETDIIRRREPAARQPAQPSAASSIPQQQQRPGILRQEIVGGPGGTGPPPAYAGFPALYPVYFDKNRSRAEGRRVSKSLAVANPLARDMVDACAALQLRTVFEPTKTHPKDWANPGRVKVDLKDSTTVKNKHHLYILVARYLADHPTTENSAGLRETVRGAPPPPPRNEAYPRPAIPRGWKMPELVPYLSPAMTGGGVSENLFQDVMKEMQGAGGPGGLGALGGGMPDMRQAMAALGGGGAPGGAIGGSDSAKKGKKGKGKA